MQAYCDLGTCRQIGMTAGPIPWTAVEAYAARKGLDDEVTELLHAVIREMDVKYLEWSAEQKSK